MIYNAIRVQRSDHPSTSLAFRYSFFVHITIRHTLEIDVQQILSISCHLPVQPGHIGNDTRLPSSLHQRLITVHRCRPIGPSGPLPSLALQLSEQVATQSRTVDQPSFRSQLIKPSCGAGINNVYQIRVLFASGAAARGQLLCGE